MNICRIVTLSLVAFTVADDTTSTINSALGSFLNVLVPFENLQNTDRDTILNLLEECKPTAGNVFNSFTDTLQEHIENCTEIASDIGTVSVTENDILTLTGCNDRLVDELHDSGNVNFLAVPGITTADLVVLQNCAKNQEAGYGEALFIVLNRYFACDLGHDEATKQAAILALKKLFTSDDAATEVEDAAMNARTLALTSHCNTFHTIERSADVARNFIKTAFGNVLRVFEQN